MNVSDCCRYFSSTRMILHSIKMYYKAINVTLIYTILLNEAARGGNWRRAPLLVVPGGLSRTDGEFGSELGIPFRKSGRPSQTICDLFDVARSRLPLRTSAHRGGRPRPTWPGSRDALIWRVSGTEARVWERERKTRLIQKNPNPEKAVSFPDPAAPCLTFLCRD